MSKDEFMFALWCEANYHIITDRFPYCINKVSNKYYDINQLDKLFK